jgi:hypothetical protein
LEAATGVEPVMEILETSSPAAQRRVQRLRSHRRRHIDVPGAWLREVSQELRAAKTHAVT